MKLFDFQNESIQEVYGNWKSGLRWVLLTLSTGGGKTVIFSEMVRMSVLKKGGFCTVLVHRSGLGKQAVRTMKKMGLDAVFVSRDGTEELDAEGNFQFTGKAIREGAQCYVCMEGTVNSRIKKGYKTYLSLLQDCNFLVVDEAHFTNFVKLYKLIDRSKFVFQVTATPLFANKKLKISDWYDVFIQGAQTMQLIEKGRLVAPVYYEHEINESELKLKGSEYSDESVLKTYQASSILETVLLNYKTYQAGEKTILFTVSIAFALEVTKFLCSNGINAKCLDSENCDESERTEIMNWMDEEEDAFLVNVGIATTGTDIPSVLNIIVLRVIASLSLYIQIVGRGGRTFEGKNAFKVFDYGNNKKRHGKWEDYRDWEEIIAEHERPKKKKKAETFGLEIVSVRALSLFPDGDDFSSKFGEKEGLVLLSPSGEENPRLSYLHAKKWGDMSLDELVVYQKLTKKKAGWLYRQVFGRHGESGLRSFFKIMGYSGEWTEEIITRYLAGS